MPDTLWESFRSDLIRWSERPPLEGGIYMQHDQRQLHERAQDNPCYMFTVEEIALLCNVSRDVVSKVRAAPDSPFFLNKCRPEWFLEWMREHPEFQLTKDPAPTKPSRGVEENEYGETKPRLLKIAGAKKSKPSLKKVA